MIAGSRTARSLHTDPAPWLWADGTRHASLPPMTWVTDPETGAALYLADDGARFAPRAQYLPTLHHAPNPVLVDLREGWDSGDPFGSAMSYLGAIADVLVAVGLWNTIPHAWGYRPSAGTRPGGSLVADHDTGEHETHELVAYAAGIDPAAPAEPDLTTLGYLLHAGAVLDRLISLCQATGRAY